MSTAEEMNVICIRTKSLHFNGIPFFNTYGSLFNNSGYFLVSQNLPALDRKDKMVRDLPCTMRTRSHVIVILKFHAS